MGHQVSIRAVMVATDFSPASDGALRMAREIAQQSNASIHAVHVVPSVTAPGQAAELLSGLARSIGPEDRVHTALLSGRPAREIVRYARDNGVDLIVVGTHGRTGVTRALLGSVAEAVVRLAPCSVLSVPASAAQAGAPAIEPSEAIPHFCVVCARETDALVCEACRSRIRGEALERKPEAEGSGRRSKPA
jgi:universal stress protein A